MKNSKEFPSRLQLSKTQSKWVISKGQLEKTLEGMKRAKKKSVNKEKNDRQVITLSKSGRTENLIIRNLLQDTS